MIRKYFFAFKACFSDHASPAGDTSRWEHALQDSDWMGGKMAASRDSDLYLPSLAEWKSQWKGADFSDAAVLKTSTCYLRHASADGISSIQIT